MRPQSSPAGQPASVCIQAPNWVGDVVMATPAFRCVRLELPQARIVLVIRDRVADVLRGAPWFDDWIVYGRGVRKFLRCAARLRAEHCQLGLVMPNSFNSALLVRLGGVRRRVGYVRDLRSFLLTDPLLRPSKDRRFAPLYMVDYYLGLCKAPWLRPHGRQTELPFAEEDMSAARAMLERAGVDTGHALFLLHPAAGFGPSKLWPEGQFAKLAEMLQSEFDAQVACIGSRETSETARRIVRMSRVRVVDLTDRGIDLHSLKCVVKLCRLLVTTDSGPRHYGVALGVPTVCLMGPTHPAYSASGLPHDHVVRVPVECGPCQRRVCRLDHRCMMRITPKMVLDACRQALSSQEREA